MWSAECEPTQEWIPLDPIPLEGSVTAMLQGDHVALDQLFEVLSSAFAVQLWGAASGDPEQEVDLRLGTKG
ncbi:hypothetical protein ACFTY8_40600 [Streptomyces mirabilis]|uniref:hypothetical protein n=1 Tax=Streptomyces mirabilis TaxID=68239 RepID=UPI0036394BF7